MAWLLEPAKMKTCILQYCEGYLKVFQAGVDSGTVDKLAADMAYALGVFSTMAASLVAVLNPRPGVCNSSASDLHAVLTYSGDELAMQALKEVFMAEAEGKAGNPWSKLIDDLLAKGQQTILLLPLADEFTAKMAAIENSQDTLCLSTVQLLSEAHAARNDFKKEMRSGLLVEFDSQLQRLGFVLVKELTAGNSEVALSQADIVTLEKVLSSYPGSETSALLSALDKWKRLNQQRLKQGGFEQLMSTYPADFKESSELPKIDLEIFLSTVQGMDFTSSAEMEQQVLLAVAWHLLSFVKICRQVSQLSKVFLCVSS